ncbi:hypothetical protein [Micromonospora sp. NPDC005197]|uniref:hypothetical protein n=1 Tax=Micromonospora sp. NPDC005197 TaxID=3157020 RepID=UPI0033A3E3E5
MLPVALTCPLWWVARWATRVLTSLAVIAALALGATTALPGSPTPAAAATSAVEPPASPDRPAAVTSTGPATSIVDDDQTAARDSAAQERAARDSAAVDESAAAWSADPQPALHDTSRTLVATSTGVTPGRAVSERSPRADNPAARAPRAPPEHPITAGR